MRARAAAILVALGVVVLGAVGARGEAGPGLAGQLLVASEQIRDPRFFRAVIYMVRHDATGALGLVVNRPLRDMPLAALLEGLGLDGRNATGSVRVHYGGPVDPARAHVLHTADYAGAGTQVVPGGIAVTTHPDVLAALARGNGPRRSLVAFGYAGWAAGQLEGEIERGGWISAAADEALVFDDDHERKWARAIARRRIDL